MIPKGKRQWWLFAVLTIWITWVYWGKYQFVYIDIELNQGEVGMLVASALYGVFILILYDIMKLITRLIKRWKWSG